MSSNKKDKPHYEKHVFLDCWMRYIPSKTRSNDDVALLYDDEITDYMGD
jgi:hypothetical protein